MDTLAIKDGATISLSPIFLLKLSLKIAFILGKDLKGTVSMEALSASSGVWVSQG